MGWLISIFRVKKNFPRSLSDFGRIYCENIMFSLFLSEFSLNMSNIRLKSERKQSQFECILATIPKVRQAPREYFSAGSPVLIGAGAVISLV